VKISKAPLDFPIRLSSKGINVPMKTSGRPRGEVVGGE